MQSIRHLKCQVAGTFLYVLKGIFYPFDFLAFYGNHVKTDFSILVYSVYQSVKITHSAYFMDFMNVNRFLWASHIIRASVFNLIKDKCILIPPDNINLSYLASEIHIQNFDILLFKIFCGCSFITSARYSFVYKIISFASKKRSNNTYLNQKGKIRI